MLVLPDLPPGVRQSLKKWARGTGPRLVKFGTEVVSSTVPLLAMVRPTTSLPLDSWRQDLAEFSGTRTALELPGGWFPHPVRVRAGLDFLTKSWLVHGF